MFDRFFLDRIRRVPNPRVGMAGPSSGGIRLRLVPGTDGTGSALLTRDPTRPGRLRPADSTTRPDPVVERSENQAHCQEF